MKAVQFDDYGAPAVLYLTDRIAPDLQPGHIRIGIAAAAVNPADVKWRAGMFRDLVPITMPHVLGYDIAGIVDAVAEDIADFAPGDRVVAMLDTVAKGGYAQLAVVAAANVARVPEALDLTIAAAVPTAGLTGLQLIEDHIRPARGETVLVTGATGAVGRFAVHAALQAGARVIAGVRARHAEAARAIGADRIIVLDQEQHGDEAFDHVADTIGGPIVSALCRRLGPEGRIRTAATTPIDRAGLLTEPQFIGVRPDGAGLARLIAAVAAGEITVPIAAQLPLTDAAEAHRLVEAGGLAGKIILRP